MAVAKWNSIGQNQRVRITTVDPVSRKVEANTKDGAIIQIAVWGQPTIFRWPKVGEMWIVARMSGYWTLVEPVQKDVEETAPLEGLNTGDVNITTGEGGRFLVNGQPIGGGGGGIDFISRAGKPASGASLDHNAAGDAFYPSWENNTFDHISPGAPFSVETWTDYGGGAYKSLLGAETSNATPSDRPSLPLIAKTGVYRADIQMQFNLFWNSGDVPDVGEYDLTLVVDAVEAAVGEFLVVQRKPLFINYSGNSFAINDSTPFVVTGAGSVAYFSLSVTAWNAGRSSFFSPAYVFAADATRVLITRLGDAA